MTSDRLRDIRDREKLATKGPWHAPGLGEVHCDHDNGVFVNDGGEDNPVVSDLSLPDDAKFIAHARQDIPDLLAALDEARELLKQVRPYFHSHHTCEEESECKRCDVSEHIDAVIGGE